MKRTGSRFILLIALLLFSAGYAQETEELLFQKGFENVLIEESQDSVCIFFEHREFRNPYYSMRFAELLLKDHELITRESKLIWIPVYQNKPVGRYEAGSYRFHFLREEDRQFYKEHNRPFKNYRLNFRIQPEVKARFGFYRHPFETKFNFNLDTQIYLLPGLSLQTGLSFPVVNSLDSQSMAIRPAPSMLHYFGQHVNGHFISASVGSFYNDRYGVDIEYRYSKMNSRWSFGLEGGITGYYRFNGLDLYHTELNRIMAVADAEYHLNYENLSLKLSAGRFLYSDTGVRMEIIKQYGNVDIGLFGSGTTAGATAGFQFAFNLFPGKIFRSRSMELRTTDEFRWEYTYNNQDFVAMKYRLGIPRLADRLRQYKEDYVQSFSR